MSKFDFYRIDRLQEAVTDYRTVVLAANAAERELRELSSALADRKKDERAQTERRIAELKTKIAAPGTSQTLRRLSGQELEELEAETFDLNEEEKVMLADVMNEFTQAAADVRDENAKVKAALRDAGHALDELRVQINALMDVELLTRRPAALRADIDKMLRQVRGEVL